jgi:hypothetical protein
MHLLLVLEIIAQIYFVVHAIKTDKARYWIYIIILVPWIGFLIYFFTEFLPELQESQSAEVTTNDEKESDSLKGNLELSDNGRQAPSGKNQINHKLAYITQGKLFYKKDSLPSSQVHSQFGQKIIDRTIRIHQKNEWKTKGSGSYFGGSTLWGVDRVDTEAIRIFITSVAPSQKDNKLYFILESETAGGLFVYNCATQEEKRLFHKENFHVRDLDLSSENKQLVCSQHFPNGIANIIMMNEDGSDLHQITEGDSIDEAPSWIPGKNRRILIQSSGIARNANGHVVGRGPAAIQALDNDNNRLATVLEDPRYDYLQPHISPDGYMYYIRRPYTMHEYSGYAFITDFLLFPFRLLRAVFHYLNFFSLVYTKKPLTTASGPLLKGDDLKNIMLRGKMIDAEKALRRASRIQGVPSLVPSSWELVRRSQNNNEKVVARNVAAFDISWDGTIAYSNGCGVFTLGSQNNPKLILKDNLIEDVIIG